MKASLVFDTHGARRRYLSVVQVAKMLGVHVHTVRRWIARHKVETVQPFPNCTRIPADEVERLLQASHIERES
jgi:excisionase family DNA binding protein